MNTLDLLRNVPVFARLEDKQLMLLAAGLHPRTFKRGTTIFHQGSPGNILYIIVSGQVRIYTTNEAGQEFSVTIFRSGDFFGELSLLDGQVRSASVEAMQATRTLTLDRRDFLRTVEACPPIAVAVLEALATRLRNSTVYAEHLAHYTAPQRVVYQLIHQAHQCATSPEETMIELRLTQDALASLSGTTRETVNRVLSTLRDQGAVQVERARIRILDPRQLQQSLAGS